MRCQALSVGGAGGTLEEEVPLPGSARLSFLLVPKALGWMLHSQGSSPPSECQGTRGGFLVESSGAAPRAASCRFCRYPSQLRRVQGHPHGVLVSSLPTSSPAPKGLLSKSDGTSLPHGQLPGESGRHPTVGGGGLPSASF